MTIILWDVHCGSGFPGCGPVKLVALAAGLGAGVGCWVVLNVLVFAPARHIAVLGTRCSEVLGGRHRKAPGARGEKQGKQGLLLGTYLHRSIHAPSATM
jgi:hypothetical protein